MFFGREPEFQFVKRRFSDLTARGGLIVFCGERRSGKTSILFQILGGRLGPEFVPVLIDMQSMAIDSGHDFLSKVAMEIHRSYAALHPQEPLGPFGAANPAAEFHAYVGSVLDRHPQKKLILLFDEYELFENKIEDGVLAEDALHVLANLMEHRSVYIVFTGSEHLEDRMKPYWRIFLGKSLHQRVSYLTRDEALRLITEPLREQIQYAPGVVDAIYRLTSGQPFYTQAICQSLVDYLNESRTRTVTSDLLSEVLTGIVDNPFPQMILLWGWMSREEKLALALLAEALADQDSEADVGMLLSRAAKTGYPVRFTEASLATALENMFRKEFLLRSRTTPPRYAFRMDLWRLWIQRMHSVWQVIRELGIDIRKRARQLPMTAFAVLLVIPAAALVWWAVRELAGGRGNLPARQDNAPAVSAAGSAFLGMGVSPPQASSRIDGADQRMGDFIMPLAPGQHRILVTHEGFMDSSFMAECAPGETTRITVSLRPQRGDLQVYVDPQEAYVFVDDVGYGRGNRRLEDLEVPQGHRIRASLEGWASAEQTVQVLPDTVTPVRLSLTRNVGDLTVTSSPQGASVWVNGDRKGQTQCTLSLPHGSYRIRIEHEGYVPLDTMFVIASASGHLFKQLTAEPPGYIEIHTLSNVIASTIKIDDETVMRNLNTSQRRPVRPGRHDIWVELPTGEIIIDTVMVRSRELVQYDYVSRSKQRRPYDGEPR